MEENFRTPNPQISISGIFGNTAGQRSQKLPKSDTEKSQPIRRLPFVTFLAIYVPFSAKSAAFLKEMRKITGSFAELYPISIKEASVAFNFAAATAGNFIKSKTRTL